MCMNAHISLSNAVKLYSRFAFFVGYKNPAECSSLRLLGSNACQASIIPNTKNSHTQVAILAHSYREILPYFQNISSLSFQLPGVRQRGVYGH